MKLAMPDTNCQLCADWPDCRGCTYFLRSVGVEIPPEPWEEEEPEEGGEEDDG